MRRTYGILTAVVLVGLLTLGTGPVLAQDDDEDFGSSAPAVEAGDGGSPASPDMGSGEYEKPVVDPFKILIVPKKPPAPPVITRPNVSAPSGPPPVPPLVMKITAVAGEDPNFVAVIEYKGADYIIEKGWEAPDKNFKVRGIYADKLEVFYSKDQSVKTFFF